MKSSKYDKIIGLAEKVDCLVDICNGWSKKQVDYTTYFTPENTISIKKELLGILAWFNKWHDKVNSIEINTNSFLPIQSCKSLQSLVFGLVGLIQANLIEEKWQLFQKQQILMELKLFQLFKTKWWKWRCPNSARTTNKWCKGVWIYCYNWTKQGK